MLLFAITIIVFLVLSQRFPEFMFWLALTIWVDPGGYIVMNLERSAVGGLQLTDLTFLLLMIPLLSPKVNIRSYFLYKDNTWIFFFLLFFSLFYHVLIFGLAVPANGFNSMLEVLQYQRLTLVGFVVIIPAYIFFRRSHHLVIKFALITSVVLSLFYLLYLFAGIELLPIWSAERRFIDVTRISMRSYGYAYWFINIAFLILLFRINLSKKKWVIFIGVTLFIAVMLTLTRRSILQVIWGFMLIYIFRQRFINQMVLSSQLIRFVIISGLFLLALNIIVPGQLRNVRDVIDNTFTTITAEESVDGRLEVNIPLHMARFRASPILGDGWDRMWLSNQVHEGGLAAHETPLTAALGMYGILGLALFSFFYFRMYKILYQSFYTLKSFFQSKDLRKKHIELFVICFVLVISFTTLYTISFMNYFRDLIIPVARVSTMMYAGFLLASRDMLKEYMDRNNNQLNSYD